MVCYMYFIIKNKNIPYTTDIMTYLEIGLYFFFNFYYLGDHLPTEADRKKSKYFGYGSHISICPDADSFHLY